MYAFAYQIFFDACTQTNIYIYIFVCVLIKQSAIVRSSNDVSAGIILRFSKEETRCWTELTIDIHTYRHYNNRNKTMMGYNKMNRNKIPSYYYEIK